MSNIATPTASAIESALIIGDLLKLNVDQRLSYYKSVCESVGLNPLTKPFDYIQLNGKLTLYAKRDATDQLRKVHGVSIKITAREKIEDIYIVTAQGTDKSGRVDESTGAVNVAGLKGDNLANAFLKAETKAKRRVTLSLCGLGLLDETEVSTISDAQPFVESQAIQNVSTIKEVLKETGFDNLDSKPKKVTPEVINHSNELGDYIIKFGKHKDKKLSEINLLELDQYVQWIPTRLASSEGAPIKGKLKEYMEECCEVATIYVREQYTKVPPNIDT